MNKQYLTFAPYRSGLCNVIMCYEMAFALAHITNRTIIIPPTTYLTHITSHGPKEDWGDIFYIFDFYEAKKLFDIVDIRDHEEFKPFLDKIGSWNSWTVNITDRVKDIFCWKKSPATGPYNLTDDGICFVNDPNRYNNEDFVNFISGRRIIDVNKTEKYLHFENNLFQHYWYLTYAGGPKERNELKRKINKTFRYNNKFYNSVLEAVTISDYNAVHIRRGPPNDFLFQFGYSLNTVNTSEKLANEIDKLFPADLPLYIASDESDRSFFDILKRKYKIYFFEDFFQNQSKLETAVLEQIICSRANIFVGTANSTYSKRIQVMRGIDGLPATDYMGINDIVDNYEIDSPYPWAYRDYKRWSWNSSSYIQWRME